MVKVFKEHNVEVVTLTPAEYDAWLEGRPAELLQRVRQGRPDGKKLIDEALAVK